MLTLAGEQNGKVSVSKNYGSLSRTQLSNSDHEPETVDVNMPRYSTLEPQL